MLRRGAPPPQDDSSSSSDEDAFSAMSRRKKKKRKTSSSAASGAEPPSRAADGPGETKSAQSEKKKDPSSPPPSVPPPSTEATASSAKRHHGTSDARRAKMDALLQELQAEKDKPSAGVPGQYGPAGGGVERPPPEKMGSYVRPGEEHLTTNIFVGNLAPSVTEESLTDLFRQFGDLYSVKIMWPRTAEERARNRNTGFVCFMTRNDAQEAMDAFNDSDPLDCGRRMVLRWGKNVKKTVKRGTGGVPIAPIKKKVEKTEKKKEERQKVEDENDSMRNGKRSAPGVDTATQAGNSLSTGAPTKSNEGPPRLVPGGASNGNAGVSTAPSESAQIPKTKAEVLSGPKYDPDLHSADAIRVVSPTDPQRIKFITTVASFVAKDGSLLERKIVERESNNPKFHFLTGGPAAQGKGEDSEEENVMNERTFYRWRVYSFANGDGFDSWRTEPFVMIEPHGRFWIPPALNLLAAKKEEEESERKEREILERQEERRKIAEKKDFMTGRQLEHAKFGVGGGPGGKSGASDGTAKLTDYESEQFDELLRKKLCANREAICKAMAFCFDKSGAALQISDLLKAALLEDGAGVSVDTRIARLYLLSDVLFNSQQPGVKNAFRYRDAVERMAPEVFASLGRDGERKGRMTMQRLRTAVGGVLSAWTNWSVYNPTFLDELHARFEGREVATPVMDKKEEEVHKKKEDVDKNEGESREESGAEARAPDEADRGPLSRAPKKPRGGWTDAEILPTGEEDVDGELYEEEGGEAKPLTDVDGLPLGVDDDVDGEALSDEDIDGEALAQEDVDGEALTDDDVDGEVLGGDNDIDGES